MPIPTLQHNLANVYHLLLLDVGDQRLEDRYSPPIGIHPVRSSMSIGVPIKVLHEAEGHIVTCETITGEVYRGKLIEAEDNMNCQMTQITVTYRDGRTANLENVYIRGSKIRFLILPDMLKNAPMFKKQGPKTGTAGRGKSAMIRAQSKYSFERLFLNK